MKRIVTIKELKDISLFLEAGISGIIVSDEFHGTRASGVFSMAEIKEASEIAKRNELILGVLMNRIYVDEELEQAENYLKFLKELQVDWIYYNDPAVVVLAEKLEMVSKLVYDPDTLMTNSYDMKFALAQGIHHAVLSTEITLEEMETITQKVGGNTEAILFGYLNMSYSKRQLIQNYCDELGVDNTLHNRRDCILIESTREGKMPIFEDGQGTHIYTDYILDAFEEYKILKDAGLEVVRIDSIFLDRWIVADALKVFTMIDLGFPGKIVKAKFEEKYKEQPWSTGYMYQKTNLVK